eukprot:gene22219-biopygen14749
MHQSDGPYDGLMCNGQRPNVNGINPQTLSAPSAPAFHLPGAFGVKFTIPAPSASLLEVVPPEKSAMWGMGSVGLVCVGFVPVVMTSFGCVAFFLISSFIGDSCGAAFLIPPIPHCSPRAAPTAPHLFCGRSAAPGQEKRWSLRRAWACPPLPVSRTCSPPWAIFGVSWAPGKCMTPRVYSSNRIVALSRPLPPNPSCDKNQMGYSSMHTPRNYSSVCSYMHAWSISNACMCCLHACRNCTHAASMIDGLIDASLHRSTPACMHPSMDA